MSSDEPARDPRPVPLSVEARTYLRQRFDIDAVEELLATMHSAEQNEFLAQLETPGFVEPGETTEVAIPIRSSDPARQALLDRIWAPFWEHLPAEALDQPGHPYPGRELARLRRDARNHDYES